MNKTRSRVDTCQVTCHSRREIMGLTLTAAMTAVLAPIIGISTASAADSSNLKSTAREKVVTKKAFVYAELQISVPFEQAPWRERNPILKKQPGLIAKTRLSGLHTNTLGGLDAFDTIENARAFALNDFPSGISRLNAAFYTRIFDARTVEEASRQMHSPFFT